LLKQPSLIGAGRAESIRKPIVSNDVPTPKTIKKLEAETDKPRPKNQMFAQINHSFSKG
jgi:hypothetical protein